MIEHISTHLKLVADTEGVPKYNFRGSSPKRVLIITGLLLEFYGVQFQTGEGSLSLLVISVTPGSTQRISHLPWTLI